MPFFDLSDDSGDDEPFHMQLFDAMNGEDTEQDEVAFIDEGYYVAMFLQQLIENQNGHGIFFRTQPPVIPHKPNIEMLKDNSCYQIVANASGHGVGSYPLNAPRDPPWSVVKMLGNREHGIGARKCGFTQPERCKLNNSKLPNSFKRINITGSKNYCGQFSKNGNYFVTGSQDHSLRVFDSSNTVYKKVNRIAVQDVSWCVVDLAFSPDEQNIAYSTWSSCIYVSEINGDNEKDAQCLSLETDQVKFCIFSLEFSNCGKYLIGGSSDGALYIYDRTISKQKHKVPVCTSPEKDIIDVHSVGFIDETSNIIYTGLDDGCIKIWDRRCIDDSRNQAVGMLVGHHDGITHIDTKNDSRYLISNSKDQSIKLWDLRVLSDPDVEITPKYGNTHNWDYQFDEVPERFYSLPVRMKEDTSVMTYRGHYVRKTLIRSKFSPPETTGQRYIYTGCASGRLIIYDVLTGQMVQSIESHTDVVRDVDWHPARNEIMTTSFDQSICKNMYREKINNGSPRSSPTTAKRQRRINPNHQPLRRSRRIANRRAAINDNA